MRIGLWNRISHISFGGPSTLLIGVICGIKLLDPDIEILINEEGDLNFAFTIDRWIGLYPKNTVFGPLVLPMGTIHEQNENDRMIWKEIKHHMFSSEWVKKWFSSKLPVYDEVKNGNKTVSIWEAGVDTTYFAPIVPQKKELDFFIYFKSQAYADLAQLQHYLFFNYFKMRGIIVTYYYYDKQMLRDIATKSKFCIMLDREETQGLAALEILSCDCPIFCLDWNTYKNDNLLMQGDVTSICSWNEDLCGMKSNLEKLEQDFPIFLNKLYKYKPRNFVLQNYSWPAAAQKLIDIGLQITSPARQP